MPAPAFRSSKTRYDRAFLVRLRAARTLRQRGLHVNGVPEQLDTLPPEEIFRLAGYLTAAELAVSGGEAPVARGGQGSGGQAAPAMATSATAASTALGSGLSGAGSSSAEAGPLPAGFLGPYRAGAAPPHERWDFLEICPGVKLMVRAEADPEAWRVASEIVAHFGPRR